MSQMAEKLGVALDLLHSDIFNISKSYHDAFDIVLEYTCYCAIDPDRRIDYVNLVDCILKPGGRLVALFFPLDKELNDDGPPFGVDFHTTLDLFLKKFTLNKKEIPKLSIERRIGREIFVIFNKNGN
jgi:SAM-dependent methyltransferase